MKSLRTLVVSALFVLIAVGVGAWLYPHMPTQVPTHWNAQGQVDGWSPRFWALALWPIMLVGLAVLTALLPAISPRQFEIQPFAATYGLFMLAMQALMLVVGVCAMLAGAGYKVPVPLIAMLAVGVLFMVLGNYMGKLRKNFFIGFRTPWTLTSDAVWERMHRLGGWVFMLAGVAWVMVAFVAGPQHMRWLVAIVLVAVLVPCGYSYFVYRRLHGRAQSGGNQA